MRIVKTLREEYRFNGYIHVKAIPGADSRLIDETGRQVDRMSVNIELPTSSGLKLLAPQKDKHSILGPMQYISNKIAESGEDYRHSRHAQPFVPAGQSTQLIVGATPDRDLSILKLSESLYKRYSLRRVFYSAYVPVSKHPALLSITKPPLLREHRLYQADWLLRFYNFNADELLDEKHQDFDISFDPKCDWALRNMNNFPVDVNRADYYMLLRVPGIGVRSARRIQDARRISTLDFVDLKKLGVVLKRARYFITCKGKYYDKISMNDTFIKQNLLADRTQRVALETGFTQVSMFLPGKTGARSCFNWHTYPS